MAYQFDTTKVRKIYDTLAANGYEQDYETFQKGFYGNENTRNRQKIYDLLKENGGDVGATYNEFMQRLEAPANIVKVGRNLAAIGQSKIYKAAAEATPRANALKPQPSDSYMSFKLRRGGKDILVSAAEAKAAGGIQAWAAQRPGTPWRVYMSGGGFDGHVPLPEAHNRWKQKGYQYTLVDTRKKQAPAKPDRPLSPVEQAHGMLEIEQQIAGENKNLGNIREQTVEHMQNVRKAATRPLGESELVVNPRTGKRRRTYFTEQGNKTNSKLEQSYENTAYNAEQGLLGQLRNAYKEREELNRRAAERLSLIDKKSGLDDASIMSSILSSGDPMMGALSATTSRQTQARLEDPEYQQYRNALKEVNKRIQILENRRHVNNGGDHGFWRSFWQEVTNPNTWLSGYTGFLDANAKLSANVNPKTESAQSMMKAEADTDEAENKYGDFGFRSRAGVMTADMLPFMVDFMMVGGAKGGSSMISRNLTAALMKGSHKIAPKITGKLIPKFFVKTLGAMPEEILRAGVMANTVQAGKTAADVVDRKLGEVTVDENGNYGYTNDKTWNSAIWQGEANAIIENYSEMFGTHLDGLMPALAKTFGGKRISGLLARTNATGFGKILSTTRKQFERLGISDYFGEVGEEYYGQLWRTMLGLDDAYRQNADGTSRNLFFDGQFHGDIWGGMALSMGIIGAGKYTQSAIVYGAMRHAVNKADKQAQRVFAPEEWEQLRSEIDATTTDNIGAFAEKLLFDSTRTPQQRMAAMNYIERSLNLRGLNLAEIAKRRGVTADDASQEQKDELNALYLQGLNVNSAEEYEQYKKQKEIAESNLRTAVAGVDGLDADSFIDELDNNPDEVLDGIKAPELLKAAQGYVNAKTIYDGTVQSERYQKDLEGTDSKEQQPIGRAVMKYQDQPVEVLSGRVVMMEDGTMVDNERSDASIVIRDLVTGKIEMVSPEAILSYEAYPETLSVEEVESMQREAQQAPYADAEPQPKYTSGQIKIRNSDGTETHGWLTGERDAEGNHEYLVEGALQHLHYASDQELDTILSDYQPDAPQEEVRQEEAPSPSLAVNDELILTAENGATVRGTVTAEMNEDGLVEVQTDQPLYGARVNMFTPDELAQMMQQTPAESAEESPAIEPTPLQRIPKDEAGRPVFEQAETPEVGWDGLVEYSKGDAAKAKKVADIMAENKRKELEKAQKLKSKGKSVEEIMESEDANAAALAQAEQEYNIWKQIANVEQRRQDAIRAQQEAEARQRAAERAEAEKEERAAREEAARLEREALEGIPEWHLDTPENARKRGVRRFSGQMFTRQEPVQGVPGKEVEVKFSQKDLPKGRVAVIDAMQLQPSHMQGQRNPMFFIEEAQPKNRAEAVSMFAAKEMAEGIRPQEITGSATAYTGAPTVNTRGEVIQGNNRSDALRYLWENRLPEQQQAYKQYIIDNAEQFGLDPEAVNAMERPVLVNMLDVDDAEAIRLGQMTAQDTESGGIERIKPKNVAQKLGDNMRTFANLLLQSGDEEASFGQLVDRNGTETLKWMSQVGAISNTQYQSAYDTKGNLTAEVKNDLQKVLYQAVFRDGSQQLEEMFDKLPAKAQRAILATAFRDMDSPFAGKMLPEIQASIAAYNYLMHDAAFPKAKKLEDVLRAVEDWKRQSAFDDTGEIYYPSDNFSNFALHLAALYKASDMSQSTIAGYFNQMYDLAQGKKAATLFEEADTTEYPLADVIKQVLGIEYQPAKNGNNNVANGGADVALRNQVGQGGELRGHEPPAIGEQNPSGTEPTERGAGTADDSSAVGGRGNLQSSEKRTEGEATEIDENGLRFVVSEDGTTLFGVIREESGLPSAPIKLSEGYQDDNGKGYGLRHIEAGHGEEIRNAGYSSVEEFVSYVAKNYDEDNIRVGKQRRNGNTTYLIQVIDSHDNTLFIELSRDGSYWNVNSGGVFRKGYSNKKETVAKTEPQQPNNAVSSGSSLSKDEQSGTSSIEPNGEPTVSDSKVNNSASDKQAGGEESLSQPSDNKGERTIQSAVEAASADVNTSPTPAQAEAGNYKKGHVSIGEFDITIENPAGSIRKGVDADGKEWSNTMANTYGYIKGTEGVDGDHIDVFLHSDMDQWNGRKVYVVDQTNTDGSFDEHKVMLGFNDKDEAMTAYLANYDKTWADTHPGLRISETNIEDFNKWVQSSHRKTKPFADYATVSKVVDEAPVKSEPQQPEQPAAKIEGDGYKIESKPYTNKQGKTLDTYLVTFDRDFSKEELSALRAKAKALKGWYDRESKGWMLRSSDDAKAFAEDVTAKSEDEIADEAPLSMADMDPGLDYKTVTNADDFMLAIHYDWGESQMVHPASHDTMLQFLKRWILNGRKRSEKQLGNALLQSAEVDLYPSEEKMLRTAGFSRKTTALALIDDKEKCAYDIVWRPNMTKGGRNYVMVTRTSFSPAKPKKAETPATPTDSPVKKVDVKSVFDAINTKSEAKLSDHAEPVTPPTPKKRRWISDEDANEFDNLRNDLRKHFGKDGDIVQEAGAEYGKPQPRQMDAEVLRMGTRMTYLMMKGGLRSFSDYCEAMKEELPDIFDEMRPHLKSLYAAAQNMEEVMQLGWDEEMDDRKTVKAFDVYNFDKHGAKDIIATAQHAVDENASQQQTDQIIQTLKDQRNEQRKEEADKTSADTEAISDKAEATASQVESELEDAGTEQDAERLTRSLDKEIEDVNKQLALLGYYEADPVESDFNEAYGYMRNAERKAVQDAHRLATQLSADLSIDIDPKDKVQFLSVAQ